MLSVLTSCPLGRRLLGGWLVANCGLGAVIAAESASELRAPHARETIVIDGKLDERIWAQARPTSGFFGPLSPDGSVAPAQTKTEVRAVWSTDTLYLAFRCEGMPGPSTLTERDGLLHKQELVEVFLDFSGQGRDYVELQVSPTGVVADLYHHWPARPTFTAVKIDESQRSQMNSDRSWNMEGFQAATGRWEENGRVRGWIAEMALPIASLSRITNRAASITEGKTLFANFVHYRYPLSAGGKPLLEQSTWVPVLEGRPHVTPMAMAAIHCVEFDQVSPSGAEWKESSQLLVNDAHKTFALANDSAKQSTRETRFGEAVTLLNVQPKTASNIDRAASLFDTVIAENGADEFGVMAQYFRGRIEQIHRAQPDLVKALQFYDDVLRRHPDDFYAQMAGVKACMLRLYVTELARPASARMEAAEKSEMAFTWPETRRDYHLLMADAYARWNGNEERELHHLFAAESAGQLNRTALADLALHVAELSRTRGDKARAIEYYHKYLVQYSREVRVYLVEQRLKELEAKR